jgi:hypothetical protein
VGFADGLESVHMATKSPGTEATGRDAGRNADSSVATISVMGTTTSGRHIETGIWGQWRLVQIG